MNAGRLQGKLVLITGAGSKIGLGHAMTLAMVAEGARVAMMDIDTEDLPLSVADAREVSGKDCAVPIVGDVTNPEDAERAVETTIRELGGFNVLINNAGINPRNPLGPQFWKLQPDTFKQTMTVNICGPFNMASAAAEHLRQQGWGRIVGVTTSLDTMLRGTPYGPSKAAHEALVASMARDLEGSGVTANVLVPGRGVNTYMTMGRDLSGPPSSDRLEPEVMQAPIVWLVSDASNGFSGRRIIGEFWDESLPIEQRLEKCSAPAGWPQLARPAVSL